jgi:hypothetical protein
MCNFSQVFPHKFHEFFSRRLNQRRYRVFLTLLFYDANKKKTAIKRKRQLPGLKERQKSEKLTGSREMPSILTQFCTESERETG